MKCNLAPKGWSCSREASHEGPCAAWPSSLWMRIKWAILLRDLSILKGSK